MLFREWRDVLVWMDLEMTGLDVEKDVIVEIAVLATSAATLEPLDAGLAVVVAQPPEVLARMGDFVRQMHERSGLLTEIGTVGGPAGGSRPTDAGVHQGPRPRRRGRCRCAATRSGWTGASSTATSPRSSEHLHYRSIDVSSIKELCRRWYPEPFAARPEKADDHRALPDITASIAELRYYRETIFK